MCVSEAVAVTTVVDSKALFVFSICELLKLKVYFIRLIGTSGTCTWAYLFR